MRSMAKTARITVIIIVCVFFAVVIALGVFYFLSKSTPSDKTDSTFRNGNLIFYDPDYETDILSDPYYLRKERGLFYSEYGSGELMDSQKCEQAGGEAAFFMNYFSTVVAGDADDYRRFFTESFFDRFTVPERFAMQRLYNLNVDLYSRESIEYNGEDAVCARYIVSFMIMYNDGTFRGDIGSDTARPLLYTLIEQNGAILINSISLINN